ncbi:MAG: putative Ig domain-containing protein [Acidobacteriota bacterium]|nr:putative Ig domain-containing protein [Acidobacteriota bacterium]
MNTPFPAATGGTPPYRYSLSGLPPGISFNAATRVASGTLPSVSRTTTYRLTYTVTGSTGATDSDTSTAIVVPP